MASKRTQHLVAYDDESDHHDESDYDNTEFLPHAKRRRLNPHPVDDDITLPARRPTRAQQPDSDPTRNSISRDLLSSLSDELLIRILSFLSLQHLLAVAPVSRRFYQLAGDSQLWKALYYARFVLPRAMRIPGFRDTAASGGGTGHKLHYSGRRTLWADGRRGGLVQEKKEEGIKTGIKRRRDEPSTFDNSGLSVEVDGRSQERKWEPVNWKRQYKIRYNWSRGKCAVEELRIGGTADTTQEGNHQQQERKVLVKVVEGIAITADRVSGLRAWDLKSRHLLAQVSLCEDGLDSTPSCIAMDDHELDHGILDVGVGFLDGSFGVWRFFSGENRLVRRYKHEKSSNGELVAMALSNPYLLTATAAVLVSLYTFEVPQQPPADQLAQNSGAGGEARTMTKAGGPMEEKSDASGNDTNTLPAPYLLTSLNSYSSRPPLALSIRKMALTTVASIAYTFPTRRGWSIGLQDMHIRAPSTGVKSAPDITTTRTAYTIPLDTDLENRITHPREPLQLQSGLRHFATLTLIFLPLCLTTPLVLHMCTSTASSLSISRGIRLWGHTSGISNAEITARGKAVSVSSRGEEMRVWELEGRSSGIGSRSIEIKPGPAASNDNKSGSAPPSGGGLALDNKEDLEYDWDERRNWVGFDDEMVIVLKEKRGGGESLMVYDFT
ncbi:hypothetical protein NCU01865 [Neurospora crassa OR74A]|uniref:F-box domain-containing protein n=1 Tax=Neurospora crassa (strain ATCC 24698 / 74-OR23-1A / CBS 708.71 / DSM 1257 / FGSC 987) TaxID=367110 RepID=Q7SHE1_NEUCR|nr:hypothetical protein NCU01865 [Neurospora crassa OR74A]EAA36260.3 hypothetical protein NCU01865 [Neurospora crassa OR74A]|eukprot:XP_965496.3 hypothetical protein NCU01865 [Neurospora crassa OR74A]